MEQNIREVNMRELIETFVDSFKRLDVIAFTGKAYSGKTTLANKLLAYLRGRGLYNAIYLEPIAANIKKIAKEQFGWDGVKDEKGRHLLQVIGVEAGMTYDPNIWLKYFMLGILGHANELDVFPEAVCIIIDDLRFQSEAHFVDEDLGGIVVHVSAPIAERYKRFEKLTGGYESQFADMMRHSSENLDISPDLMARGDEEIDLDKLWNLHISHALAYKRVPVLMKEE